MSGSRSVDARQRGKGKLQPALGLLDDLVGVKGHPVLLVVVSDLQVTGDTCKHPHVSA